MKEFRKLLTRKDKPLVDNFRPLQPLGDRKVEYTVCETGCRYDWQTTTVRPKPHVIYDPKKSGELVEKGSFNFCSRQA